MTIVRPHDSVISERRTLAKVISGQGLPDLLAEHTSPKVTPRRMTRRSKCVSWTKWRSTRQH
jgi:hypothetical protein